MPLKFQIGPEAADVRSMGCTLTYVGGCKGCGYDLRGLQSAQCPECGRAFDPNDGSTVVPIGTPFKLISRWSISRVSWAAWMFTVCGLAMLLWQARYRTYHYASENPFRVIWPILFTFWSARLLAEMLTKLRLRNDAEFRKRIGIIRTALVMLAIIGVYIVIDSGGISKPNHGENSLRWVPVSPND